MVNDCIFQDDNVIVDSNGNIYSKYDNFLIANCGTSQKEALASILQNLELRYKDILRELDLYRKKTENNALNRGKLKQIEEGLERIQSLINRKSYAGSSILLQERLDALKEHISSHQDLYKENCSEILEKKADLLEELSTMIDKLKETNRSVRFFKNRYYILVDKWKNLPRLKLTKDRSLWKQFNTLSDQFIQHFEAKLKKENSKIEEIQVSKQQIIDNMNKLQEEFKDISIDKQKDRVLNTLHRLDKEWGALDHLPYYVEQNLTKQYLTIKKQLFGKLKVGNVEIHAPGLVNNEIVSKKINLIKKLEKILANKSENIKQSMKELETNWHNLGSRRSDGYDKRFFGLINEYYVNEQHKQISNKYSNDLKSKLEDELLKLKNKLEKANDLNNTKEVEEIKKQLEVKESWFAIIS